MYAFEEHRNEALRKWAKGSLPDMAGVELLIRSGWAERMDKGNWITSEGGYAWPRVAQYLEAGRTLSGGERRQLTLIASMMGQRMDEDAPPVASTLSNDLCGTDHSFIRLFQKAVGIAAGMYETWPEVLTVDAGRRG